MRDKPSPLTPEDEQHFLRYMRNAGLTGDAVRIIAAAPNNQLAIRMVSLVQQGTEAVVSDTEAQTIMGENFFGLADAVRHFGVRPTQEDVARLATVPFSAAVLQACSETHVLAVVFPLSILAIRGKVHPRLFYEPEKGSYEDELWAQTASDHAQWHLVLKEPVRHSLLTTWESGTKLLMRREEVPTAQIMVYTIIGHFLTAGERLFPTVYVRCSDAASRQRRAGVGYFGPQGLMISASRDESFHKNQGLAAVRMY